MSTETAVKERPILFSGPMVKAIRDGRKTQTRRVITPQPSESWMNGTSVFSKPAEWAHYYKTVRGQIRKNLWIMHPTKNKEIVCPYGTPEDRLLCYTCINGQTDNTQTHSRITERRLQSGIGRANLQPDALRGIRPKVASGMVSAEGQLGQKERQAHVSQNQPLPRKQEGYEIGSSVGVHGVSWDAAKGQAGSETQRREQGEQQAVESVLGEPDRELARQEDSRNGHGRRGALGGEVHKRGTEAHSLGSSEGALQSEARGACAQCQLVVDKRYRCGGARLWVRESFYAYGHYQHTGNLTETGKREIEFIDLTLRSNLACQYAVDTSPPTSSNKFDTGWHKRPSIFMPRWASRINLEITNVRVERLQEISEVDAKAEGIQEVECIAPCFDGGGAAFGPNAQVAFMRGWDSINGKRKGCTWADNPWVWALEFKRL